MKTKHAGITNRRNALNGEQRQEIVRLNREGKLSSSQLAHQYAVSRMTIYRIVKRCLEAAPKQEVWDWQGISQQQANDACPGVYSSYG